MPRRSSVRSGKADRVLPGDAEGRERLRNWFRLDVIILGGVILVVAYLAVTPLAMLLYGSLRSGFLVGDGEFTFANYVLAYTDREFYALLFNSLVYALGVSFLTFLIGTALAWICERTNTPGQRLFAMMAVTNYIIPGVLLTISWILLLSPRIGFFNTVLMKLFGLSEPPLTIYSYWGMIWTASLHLYPLTFLMMSAAFRSMDGSLEEAAWTAGASHLGCLRQITLKILRPAVFSGVLILFVRGIESFEVPALIGIPARIFVFTTKIYEAASGFPPALGLAGANAATLLLISILGVYLYQRLAVREGSFATITGKGYRPRVIDLGKWKYLVSAGCALFFIITLLLPALALLGTSFSGYLVALSPEAFKNFSLAEYRFVLSYPIITRAFRNSLILAAGWPQP